MYKFYSLSGVGRSLSTGLQSHYKCFILHSLIFQVTNDMKSCTTNCFSYGAGLLGALAYMRMLGNSIDSMADGARGVIKYAFCSFFPFSSQALNILKWMAYNVYVTLP